ncbi:hypothetical protein, partial [Enterobacter oligotrophicus]|uniref:hypothetical protein n=1 Tax=Enterobacter oligotrophicus TaxID=2478464 RepID=UPI0023F46938
LYTYPKRNRLLRFLSRKLSALIQINRQKTPKTPVFTEKDAYLLAWSFRPYVVNGSLRARKFSLMFF